MKTRTMWVTVTLAAILVMMAGAAGALQDPSAPEAAVASKINYQGRLTDPDGLPLDGTFPMRFRVYDDPGGGTMLWDSGPLTVDVDRGLFNTQLPVEYPAFNGQALWLQIYVNFETLTPRQELLPVPYALSLRPGAIIQGVPTEWEGHVLRVNMAGAYPLGKAIWGSVATGQAVRGNATGGYGMIGYTEEGYAVYGIDAGTSQARGYGGFFTSNTGIGVYGYSSATSIVGNAYTPGVHGRSLHGVGIYGLSDGESSGVWGSSADGNGVLGTSENASGVYGRTENDDGDVAAGVWGQKWTGNGIAVRGVKEGDYGIGIKGSNYGTTGSAVAADSTNYNGVYAWTDRPDNSYGVYTPDNIYSLNYHLSGAVMQVVQNGGKEPLEQGDVVVFSGIAAPLEEGGPPVVQVSKATSANSTAVAGVVYSRFNIESVDGTWQPDGHGTEGNAKVLLEGLAPPGEYLLLIIQGPAQVKASALSGAIRPGDLLSSAGEAGQAAKAAKLSLEGVEMAAPGTVFGKALEPLDADQGLIYVFVTLQ